MGEQVATRLLSTGTRFGAEQAVAWGAVDELADETSVTEAAVDLAAQLAAVPPDALRAIRQTMRGDDFAERFRAATARESAEQSRLRENVGSGTIGSDATENRDGTT